MKKSSTNALKEDIKNKLLESVSSDYIEEVLSKIEDDILIDVSLTSDFLENGQYTEDDIRMSIGRVLLNSINKEK